uniref:hypothetical protein n=1 Tax=Listeria ilorinensis TaxID=2867439 RepID=UPI001EF73B88
MRVDTWKVEIYIRFNPLEDKTKVFTIETQGYKKATAIKSAKSKMIAQLKKEGRTFERVALIWIEHENTRNKSVYETFTELKQARNSKKEIMKKLRIQYSEYCFYNQYY